AFEWLHIWHLQLIARFESLQFARIKLFKEVNVAVKFFRNCIGDITVRQKFQFCLFTYVARQPSNTLEVRFRDRVWNEHRLDAAEIESRNIRRNIRVRTGSCRRSS